MAKLGVGIVGANLGAHGGWGSWGAWAHLPALAALEQAGAVAVATTHQASADETAAKFGLPNAFGDWRRLIEHPAVDIVSVCVRVPAHREIVLAAIDAGKHVYCEWPLGRDTAQAEEMLAAARARGIVHALGLQARSASALRYLRDLLAEGTIGTVRSVTLSHSHDWIPQVTPGTAYLQDRSTGAHFLSIPGGHSIDALCWLLGEFASLAATVRTTVPALSMLETGEPVARTSADQVVASGVLESGTLAAIRLSAATSHGTGFRLEISGDGGDLIVAEPPGLHGVQVSNLELYRSAGMGELPRLEVPESYVHVPPAVRGSAAANVAEAYVALAARIAGHETELPDFADGVTRHRTLDRIEAASHAGDRG